MDNAARDDSKRLFFFAFRGPGAVRSEYHKPQAQKRGPAAYRAGIDK